MARPDDITETAWAEACRVANAQGHSADDYGRVVPIARALMAAEARGRAEEREAARARRVGVTPQQRRTLDFIRDCASADGFSPSFEEIREFLGLRSRSGVHRLVSGLEERGYIARLPGRVRAVVVIDTPEAV